MFKRPLNSMAHLCSARLQLRVMDVRVLSPVVLVLVDS